MMRHTMGAPHAILRAQAAELEATLVQQRTEAERAAEQHKRVINATETRLASIQQQLQLITYPADTLPPEILCEIFRFYHKADAAAGNPLQPLSSPNPLTRVCRTWRRTALSLSELWCSLTIDLVSPEPLPRRMPQILAARVAAARSRPLKVALTGHPGRQNPSPAVDVEDLRPFFVRYAPRMAELTLHQAHADVFDIMDDWDLDFPLLEDATLSHACIYGGLHASFCILNNAPRLRKLELENVQIWPMYAHVSWTSLTHLVSTAATSVAECLRALKFLPLLEDFLVTLASDCRQYNTSPFKHDRLQSVQIYYEEARHLNSLLGTLTLPGLQKLELGGVGLAPYGTTKMEAFLRRSSPPLSDLSLMPAPITLEDLLPFTGNGTSRRNLVNLKINFPSPAFTEQFLDAWASDAGFCSEMMSLSFHLRYREGALEVFLKRVAETTSRRREIVAVAAFKLRRLEIGCTIPGDRIWLDEELAGLRQLKADGLDVFLGDLLNHKPTTSIV
ncbi:F-box domain-containing protein [Mycena chlorophos]|uniref:F-box domain-containing protein n=1 Tax=Mycena chlorophos TaxID=658473 RepID=A0A8H6WFB7_MYCCL|nr:F-box domain-containing protein [Mycena chlorophos]